MALFWEAEEEKMLVDVARNKVWGNIMFIDFCCLKRINRALVKESFFGKILLEVES